MTRVRTRFIAPPPTLRRSAASASVICAVVVRGRYRVNGPPRNGSPDGPRARDPRGGAGPDSGWLTGGGEGSPRPGCRPGRAAPPRPASRPAPLAAVAGQQFVTGTGTPGARLVRFGAAALGPELLDRVEDAPRQLHLLLVGEQRRVADEHVQDQPLVRLGTGLGEGLAVAEVHADVAHLHAGARHLGAEP